MSGGLVGDDSQREVLPLGPLSASLYKYQRYALIFLLNSQTLRRKRKKTSISWARSCANPFTYLTAFPPVSGEEGGGLLRPFTERTGPERDLPTVTQREGGASSRPSPLQRP